ncbi:NAD(P)-dependent malic enzyme [Liberiplasma polymorphum]|uniref:NAD(P)-dependent malic enzyme n=1 Tax=Liberiplasma polymorphum TaxID=3374570 RepID=UPI003775A57C
MDYKAESLKLHKALGGKIEMNSRVTIESTQDLSIVYSPGVSEPCLEIQKDPTLSYVYTRRHNTVAVITDGSAVLGLGNIGPEASMPVMEGKAVLFKLLGDVDAIPLCLKTQDTDEIVNIIYALSGSFGGINLEDIAAPRCFEIERRLQAMCDIPIFHDDQHGTAIVVMAAVINALKVVGKNIGEIKAVINGVGAAGTAIAEFLLDYGIKDLILCDKFGILSKDDNTLSETHMKMALKTNTKCLRGTLSLAVEGADLFIGVSGPNCLTSEDIKKMNAKAIVLPLANPTPEIGYELAKTSGAHVVGTGLSNFPNQINNLLAFPGVFRGTFDAKASEINREMMIAAAQAIANSVSEAQLSENYIIPNPLDKSVHHKVATAVKESAIRTGASKLKNVQDAMEESSQK